MAALLLGFLLSAHLSHLPDCETDTEQPTDRVTFYMTVHEETG